MDSGTDAAVLSSCGHPGDVGNSKGVGKFCMMTADCKSGSASTNLCSALGNGSTPQPDDTYFCTIYPCHPIPDGGTDGGVDAGTPTDCGENATCICASAVGGSGCACTPNSCN
jgi:hypothetical protein